VLHQLLTTVEQDAAKVTDMLASCTICKWQLQALSAAPCKMYSHIKHTSLQTCCCCYYYYYYYCFLSQVFFLPWYFSSIIIIIIIIIIDALFLIQVYIGSKLCPSVLETVGLRVPTLHLRDFPLFHVCPNFRSRPSVRCVSAANVVCRDFDFFRMLNVSLENILL
jgi:hypothetical protein